MASLTSRLQELEQAQRARPKDHRVLLELARVWRRLNSPAKAERLARSALALGPQHAKGWNMLGATLLDQQQVEPALEAFRTALRWNPRLEMAKGNLAACMGLLASGVHKAAVENDWGPYRQLGMQLLADHRDAIAGGDRPIIAPFSALGFQLSGEEQRSAAEAQARVFLAEQDLPVAERRSAPDSGRQRVRIGYLSADFRNNAAGHLLHQIFGHHDRDRFEVTAYSHGPDDGSDFRRTIMAGVEHFVDLRKLDDAAAAEQIRGSETDLIVDLMGFAGNHRSAILARRPAPVQVSWLGYCMTTGAPWIDEYYADSIVVPKDHECFFSETIAWLPDSYQVYSPLDFDAAPVERAACGLPADAFVYACFNMPEKVDFATVDHWSAILREAPDSVLWLLAPEPIVQERYSERFGKRDIDPSRLVFAPMLPKRRHLARLRHADLFLDTPLCNAHTTASDALWAGVPVLTCPGELLAQRVAASVSRAAGLPDLIASTMEEYRQIAIALAEDPERLCELKAKLAEARGRAPLFDVPGFVGHLESLFLESLGRCRNR